MQSRPLFEARQDPSPPQSGDDLDQQIRRAAHLGDAERLLKRRFLAEAAEQEDGRGREPSSALLVFLSMTLLASTTFALTTMSLSIDSKIDQAPSANVRGEIAAVVHDVELFEDETGALPRTLEELDYSSAELRVVHYEVLGDGRFRVTLEDQGVRLARTSGKPLQSPVISPQAGQVRP